MTEEEIQEFINMFETVKNPENYPKCFEFYIKLYKKKKKGK